MTSNDYDVHDLENLSLNPYCNHGPTVIFSNKIKKFYACSACRDHKLCNFYTEYDADKKISVEKLKSWKNRYLESNIPKSDYQKDLKKVRNLPSDKRKYCHTCQLFIFDSSHKEHQILDGITDEMLNKPIKCILEPLMVNSSNAQFLFNDSTIDIITDLIKKQSFDSVMCIGTPSIFEKLQEIGSVQNRILMDIDERFARFYENNLFIRYNMFNNHFFVLNQKESYFDFLNKSKKLLLVIDPPYGGIVKLIANSLELIKKDFNKSNLSIILFYPYFIEKWITSWLPDLKMIDFKVSYENQKKFAESGQKKGSPARLFTNIDASLIELPTSHGYIYCELCRKYTFKENKHCIECNKCTSKDGGVYKHCNQCNHCTKITYNHCAKCNSCHLDNDCLTGIRSDKRKLHSNKNNKTVKVFKK